MAAAGVAAADAQGEMKAAAEAVAASDAGEATEVATTDAMAEMKEVADAEAAAEVAAANA